MPSRANAGPPRLRRRVDLTPERRRHLVGHLVQADGQHVVPSARAERVGEQRQMGVGGERQPVVAHLGGREPTGRLRGHQQAQAWIVRDGRELAAVPLDHHVGRGGRDRVEQSGTVVDGHLGCGCEPPGAHVEQRAGQPQVVAALYAHTRREQRRARTCGVLEHPARMLGRLDLPDRRRDVCRAARRLHRSAGLVGPDQRGTVAVGYQHRSHGVQCARRHRHERVGPAGGGGADPGRAGVAAAPRAAIG